VTSAHEWALGNQQERDEARSAEEQAEIEAEDAAADAPEAFITCTCNNGQHRNTDWWGSLVTDQTRTTERHTAALQFISRAHVVRFEMTVVA